jgi:hypothetical protein
MDLLSGEPSEDVMLTTRGAKRDKTSRFKADRRLDVFDDGKPIGQLVCDIAATQCSLTLHDNLYTLEFTDGQNDERLARLLAQHAKVGAKAAGKPFALKDSTGSVIALAKLVNAAFIVAHGDDTFVLRKPSSFSRPYHLYPTNGDQSLGSVGQKSFFNRSLHVDLAAEFHAAFRMFLLVLLLQIAMQKMSNLNAYN